MVLVQSSHPIAVSVTAAHRTVHGTGDTGLRVTADAIPAGTAIYRAAVSVLAVVHVAETIAAGDYMWRAVEWAVPHGLTVVVVTNVIAAAVTAVFLAAIACLPVDLVADMVPAAVTAVRRAGEARLTIVTLAGAIAAALPAVARARGARFGAVADFVAAADAARHVPLVDQAGVPGDRHQIDPYPADPVRTQKVGLIPVAILR